MRKPAKKEDFINNPQYPGGDKAINEIITQNLTYPTSALEKKAEGTVHINYGIDIKGNIVETKVISGFHKDCDKEAQRLVRLLKFTVPKNPNGLRLVSHKDIFIHFRLPKTPQTHTQIQTPPILTQQVNYQFTTTPATPKQTKSEKPQPSKKSYQININIHHSNT